MKANGAGRASVRPASMSGDEVTILGVRFDRVSRSAAVADMEGRFSRHAAVKVYIVNAHTLNLACARPGYRDILNAADLLLNDGSGVQIASRLAGKPFPDNLVGTDLVPELCAAAVRRGVSVYLLGGESGVAERAGDELRRRIPGLKIAGSHHGYLGQEHGPRVIESINRSGAGIVLVAFGNPLQETWIHNNAPGLKCDLCIGVGGLFDHLSGRLRRAPAWMRRAGIEWVHILLCQPHKWKRYILGNPLFAWRVLVDQVGLGQ